MNDMPHDDGPKVAKLFADIDARVGHREVLPAAMDLRAQARPEVVNEATGGPDCGGCAEDGGHEPECLHEPWPEGENSEGLAVNGDPLPAAEEEAEPAGHALIQHVGQRLHQAGEAAIAILSSMAEAEFAMGNPRNMPEPMLGWYGLTLAFQLCLFEFTARDYEERDAHARQLDSTLKALGDRTDYARGVQEEIKQLLADRVPVAMKLLGLGEDSDLSYGVLAWS